MFWPQIAAALDSIPVARMAVITSQSRSGRWQRQSLPLNLSRRLAARAYIANAAHGFMTGYLIRRRIREDPAVSCFIGRIAGHNVKAARLKQQAGFAFIRNFANIGADRKDAGFQPGIPAIERRNVPRPVFAVRLQQLSQDGCFSS